MKPLLEFLVNNHITKDNQQHWNKNIQTYKDINPGDWFVLMDIDSPARSRMDGVILLGENQKFEIKNEYAFYYITFPTEDTYKYGNDYVDVNCKFAMNVPFGYRSLTKEEYNYALQVKQIIEERHLDDSREYEFHCEFYNGTIEINEEES